MRYAIFITLLILANEVSANNYYFSSTIGDDLRATAVAQNASTPWKTLNKLNNISNTLTAGDSVFFKCDDVFYGHIIISTSGLQDKPIVFTSYGEGNKPVITGLVTISGWATVSSKVSAAPFNAGSGRNIVLINGVEKAMGRYPNKTYLTFESANGNTSITDNQLLDTPNWTGAEVVIRKTRWVLDRNLITQHSGNTINYTSESSYGGSPNYGYFIQNDIKTLDESGEWYFDVANKEMNVCFGTSQPQSSIIQASNVDTLVSINNNNNLSFINVAFTGANMYAFEMNNAQQILVNSCDISFSGINAIDANNTNYITIKNSSITYSNNTGFNGNGSGNTSIINNNILFTGIYAGMGEGNSGSYEGILINGDNNVIRLNNIDSAGYIPLTFSGSNISIENNFIKTFAFIKDDGGGIYTWNNTDNAMERTNQVIKGNVIIHGKGAGAGTDNSSYLPANGIYIDDNSSNVDITSNTVADCKLNGIYLHNAHSLTIDSNTSYANTMQLAIIHDNIASNRLVNNISLNNNVFFSNKYLQPVVTYNSASDDVSSFGTFNNNYYCRPLSDSLTIAVNYNENGVQYNQAITLAEWKQKFNNDISSHITPEQFTQFSVKDYTGANQFSNGNFTSNVNGLYCYSSNNNCNTSWSSTTLDSGALSITFSPLTGNTNTSSLIIGIGNVTANKNYAIQFSILGQQQYKNVQVYLRQSLSPYGDLSARKFIYSGSQRSENILRLVPLNSETNASLVFDIPEQSTPLYLDNIQTRPANMTVTNLSDSILFLYNALPVEKNINLSSDYIDVQNKSYSGSVQLAPFSSLILLRKKSSQTQALITFKRDK